MSRCLQAVAAHADPEPAEHRHGFGAHLGVFGIERAQRGRERAGVAQLAQSAQHGTAHERLGPFGPSAQHGARCRVLQFGQALRGGGAHVVVRIEQCAAQRIDDVRLLPCAEHTGGFAAHVGRRIVAQRGDERGYEPGVLEVGEFEQCDATHGGIGRGEAGDECGFVGASARGKTGAKEGVVIGDSNER